MCECANLHYFYFFCENCTFCFRDYIMNALSLIGVEAKIITVRGRILRSGDHGELIKQ